MTFAENIKRICLQKETTLTSVVKQVKGSSSFVTSINNGSLPKETEMVEMAKILGCSVMDFFADEEDLALRVEPQDEDETDLLRVFRSLSRKNRHEFMAMVYNYERLDSDDVTLYRAARTSTKNTPEIVTESKDKLNKLHSLPKVTDEKDL